MGKTACVRAKDGLTHLETLNDMSMKGGSPECECCVGLRERVSAEQPGGLYENHIRYFEKSFIGLSAMSRSFSGRLNLLIAASRFMASPLVSKVSR